MYVCRKCVPSGASGHRKQGRTMAEKHVYRFGFVANGNNVSEVAGESVAVD